MDPLAKFNDVSFAAYVGRKYIGQCPAHQADLGEIWYTVISVDLRRHRK